MRPGDPSDVPRMETVLRSWMEPVNARRDRMIERRLTSQASDIRANLARFCTEDAYIERVSPLDSPS